MYVSAKVAPGVRVGSRLTGTGCGPILLGLIVAGLLIKFWYVVLGLVAVLCVLAATNLYLQAQQRTRRHTDTTPTDTPAEKPSDTPSDT
ncbi:hypothetical protein [Pseudonocardia acidicola]|uniref:Uncharacterized protein n=1 Tax=Pseudonocardia acidicola TaxID=2724939 RepID=A0ABX1SBG4_9PSEU|nr:hypothetical protein [Pseudonocardia acidicola]NMH98901.1 hypothetical protein [Pseudonocardia acidicola]